MDIKENAKNTDVWIRGVFILVYGVIFYFLFGLIWLVVIFQFVIKLLTTELNEELASFSESLSSYVTQILSYITFKSEERPFPFSPWPVASKTIQKKTTKKTTRKKTTRKETESKTDENKDS